MVAKRVKHTEVREGYDRWASEYDATPNPLVAMDRRFTLARLAPKSGERIMDAACGTGRNMAVIARAGCRPVGLDFSLGMLKVARGNLPQAPLVQADLERRLPVRPRQFEAVLCALVGEHLTRLVDVARGMRESLVPGGRMVFSVFHPELAANGIEANFEQSGVEYRLGAERHSVGDYLETFESAGFGELNCTEYRGDEQLVREVPWATKYLGAPILLLIEARRRT